MLASPKTVEPIDQIEPTVEMIPEPTDDTSITVESRFGTLNISRENILSLPKGLLGFSEYTEFGLSLLPDGQHPQFQVLQCLEAPELSFLVAPLNLESNAITEEDLQESCNTLQLDRNNLAALLIVTVRRDSEGAHISVNMRAPLFVDIAKHVARQYVIPNSRYSIRHVL